MNQLGPFVVLIGIAALALSGLGGAVAWWNGETRRILRGLHKVLDAVPQAAIIAPGRGRGAGFHFTSNTMAVAWDGGGWCLVYRIEELLGAELVIDGDVVARSWRGEARRALDSIRAAGEQVLLRLVFDDPQYPDFALELWTTADAARRRGLSAQEAVEEGNRWIARTESIFRRQASPAARPARPAVQAPQRAEPEPTLAPAPAPVARQEPVEPAPQPPTPLRQELPFDDPPPWEADAEADDLEEVEDQALLRRRPG
jgi:hypothetical protein